MDGVRASLSGTWNFVTRDAWKGETWKQTGLFLEEAILGTSTVKVTETPRVDAAVARFNKDVIHGDAYSRAKFISQTATDITTGYVAGEALAKGFQVAKAQYAKYMVGRFIIGEKTLTAVTEHLKQFGESAENAVMLERMQKIAKKELVPTQIDINFARHELRESELMKQGMKYEVAHEAVLKEQNMYHTDYEKKLYTEEALKAGNDQWERDVKNGKKSHN